MDPGRNLHLERSLLDSSTVPMAIRARVFDLLPGAAASRTGLRSDELTERAPRDVLQAARAAAGHAGDRSCTRCGPATRARGAGDGDRKRNLPLRSGGTLDELDLNLDGQVRPTRPRRPAADPEQVVTEEGRKQVGEAAQVELRRRETAAAEPRMTEAVVKLARLALRQNLVGLDHLAKPLLRVRGLGNVRVQLARKPSEGSLDLALVRPTGDAEHLVIIPLGGRHQPSLAPAPAVNANSPRRSPRRSGRAPRRLHEQSEAP